MEEGCVLTISSGSTVVAANLVPSLQPTSLDMHNTWHAKFQPFQRCQLCLCSCSMKKAVNGWNWGTTSNRCHVGLCGQAAVGEAWPFLRMGVCQWNAHFGTKLYVGVYCTVRLGMGGRPGMRESSRRLRLKPSQADIWSHSVTEMLLFC